MTRIKKSRKVNSNGPTRPAREKKEALLPSKKRGKGLKAGSRHSGAEVQHNPTASQAKDPRHGSKKAVPLFVDSTEAPKAKALAPEKELAKLENDPRLHDLLERLEDGEVLSQHDQFWLETNLARIAVLMDELGIEEEEEAPAAPAASKPEGDDDLLAQFDQGEDLLKQFKE
ncbi:Der GTPase-activating protein YihI [Ferrimonas marina]|uniref:Der GTPase-activating protein YihI n=1 Tax=Ferrimonas marina TaxID=299255 RepID=A0A1M5XQH9_9GAMM|nr:Der GTPase-activating protein YihI [Ferrimonas marina]SHI01778.1 hypothetical protein SAMN02745129_3587 [Ferrimonas marina]